MSGAPPASPPGADVALAAAAVLRARLADPIRLADLADEVGYSPFHLTRLFTRVLRVPPGQYLAGLRFERAKHLLLGEGLPVVDACTAVGFSSPGTFTRRFTAQVGVPPAALRRLADRVASTTLPAFRLGPPPGEAAITGTVRIPDALRPLVGDDPLIWLGLFEAPVATGRPAAGVLRHGDGGFSLPVSRGAPWLLAVACRATAEPLDHLAPVTPLWGGHPAPLTAPASVELELTRANAWDHPLITALAGVSGIDLG